MPIRRVRVAVAGFFVLYLLAVTWPLGKLFGEPEPFVLGLPFSLFWPALWIVMGGVALALLDRAEEARRARNSGSEGPPEPGVDAPDRQDERPGGTSSS